MTDNLNIKNFKSILMPRFDTFGDIVLLQGLIAAILDYLPDTRITLLVRSGYEQLASMFPQRLIWKTTQINPYKKLSDTACIKSLLEELQKDDYDLLLVTTYNRTWPDDLVAASLPSIKRIALGEPQDVYPFLRELLADFSVLIPEQLYDKYIPVEEKSHETDKYQTFWERITGQIARIPSPKLIIPEDASRKASKFIADEGIADGEFVFCFPAGIANVSLKTWPVENFAAVIAHLEKTRALKTLIAGQDMEKSVVEKVAELAGQMGANPFVWLGKDGDIPLACAFVEKSAFYLGNDTGLMHMAAALNKPVIAIFGGGTWPRFLPNIDIGAVFTKELPCSYCNWDPCCFLDAPCVKMVNTDSVVSAIEKLLRKELKSLEIQKEENIDSTMVDSLLLKAKTAFTGMRQAKDRAEAESAARFNQITELTELLRESEADRAARLEQINELVATINQLESKYRELANTFVVRIARKMNLIKS